jgi:predicted ribosome quality control (RQC) complex YloA/Tae2 family protein
MRQYRKTRTRDIVAALSILGLLGLPTSSAFAVGNTDVHPSRQNVGTASEHEAVEKYYEEEARKRHEIVAKYYEDEAGKMQAKAKELKLLLEHYEDKSYLYGKKAQDLQAHTEALVRKYENAARTDATEAASHRQIASKLRDKERSYAETRSQRLSAIDGSHGSKVSRE